MRLVSNPNRPRFAHQLFIVSAVFAVLHLALAPAWAMYMRPDLEKIPVEKLIENLEKQAKEQKKDITLRLNLARAHAMAFASKGAPVDIRKGKEGEGIFFGFEPENVPFGKVQPSDDPAIRKAAEEQLKAAIADYEAVLKLNKEHLQARLGYAWCLQQADKNDEALEQYRQVVEESWKTEKDMEVAPLGYHSLVAEAASYMIPLLDQTKDAAEIQELRTRAAKANSIPRPITPIAIPLRDGLRPDQLLNRDASVAFDADGSGRKDARWDWITPDAAWLVYDLKGDGKIDSALQMFGNVSFWMFWEHGYQPLAVLDADGDGELRGPELEHLSLWHDINGNGRSEPGEVRTLAEHGIVALSCKAEASLPATGTSQNALATGTSQSGLVNPSATSRVAAEPANVAAWSAVGVTFADGTVRPTYDLVLQEQRPSN